jgi:H-type lectin domain
MKRFSGTLGVQQGTRILFSDFAHDGAMWTGSGPREVRRTEAFGEPFLAPPAVMVSVSMWDIDNKANSRIDLSAENITAEGFEIVCRTWSDSRIARIRADWMAIGATQDDEAWDVI